MGGCQCTGVSEYVSVGVCQWASVSGSMSGSKCQLVCVGEQVGVGGCSLRALAQWWTLTVHLSFFFNIQSHVAALDCSSSRWNLCTGESPEALNRVCNMASQGRNGVISKCCVYLLLLMLKECLSRSAFPDNICHCLTDIVPVDEK